MVRRYRSPPLLIRPMCSFPPLAWIGGVNPSQAAKWQAELELSAVAHRGNNRRRRQRSDTGCRGQPAASFAGLVPSQYPGFDLVDPFLQALQVIKQDADGLACLSLGNTSGSLRRIRSRSSSTRRIPLAATMPNSLSRPRSELTAEVRSRTSSARTRCRARMPCCSMVLIGTKRLSGLATASQIASASAASVLLRLTPACERVKDSEFGELGGLRHVAAMRHQPEREGSGGKRPGPVWPCYATGTCAAVRSRWPTIRLLARACQSATAWVLIRPVTVNRSRPRFL